MRLPLLGIGSVSAAGCGVGSLKAALEGCVAPRIEHVTIGTETGKTDMPVYTATPEGLEAFLPRRALRRLDKFTRMALLASFMAVEDSGVLIEDRSRIGIVFGTGYGPLRTTFAYQDTIIDDGDDGASPTLFANSVHNALASGVSILMKIEGPCLTLTNFARSTTEVLRTAGIWLSKGTVDYVLAGAGDEFCDVLGYTAHKWRAGSSDRIDPLRFDRCSHIPGEGFVAFLLGRENAEGKYGSIRGIASQRVKGGLDRRLLESCRGLLLSANGDSRTGTLYKQLELTGIPAAAYCPLYGSLPVGLAFDVALAGVCCGEDRLFASPAGITESDIDVLSESVDVLSESVDVLSESVPLRPGDRIGCIDCSPGHVTLVTIENK